MNSSMLLLLLALVSSVQAWSSNTEHPVRSFSDNRQTPSAVEYSHAVTGVATSPGFSRKEFFKRSSIFISIVGTTMKPSPSKAATPVSLPEEGEIAAAIPKDWNGVGNPLMEDSKSLLGRLDSTPDSNFYKDPRFVEHVDDNAVQLMTRYISNVAVQKGDKVLDLCSSWTSHMDSSTEKSRVSGLGMNDKELSSNPSLTDWVVRDLNQDPKLPYEDATFDVVLCQLSIDYLTKPLEVLREAGRVLVPGGKIHILFSNRLFLSKAVALWTGADDIDHAYTVGCYLHFCNGGFDNISAQDLSTRKGKRIIGDPLYVVSATKR